MELDDRADLPAADAARLARDLTALRSLDQVIRWGLALPRPSQIVEVVVQDEYCHDVVMRWRDQLHLVFDTT